MIKKFEDWLNEGLWSKTLNRGRTGERRIEDTNPQFEKYLENIEWMDMGLKDKLYAKIDFNEGMSINQIKNLKLPEGVEIMSGVDFYMLKGLCDISKNSTQIDDVDVKVFSVFNPRNKDKIYFNLNIDLQYFTDLEKDDINVINMFGVKTTKKNNVDFDCPEYIFKLVKNKTVNEGLWSKTLNRGRTGEKRLEDIDMTPDERKCYELLKEWCEGGQLNITQGKFEPRHSFDKDWGDFQKNLFDQLSKLNCCEQLINNPYYPESKSKIVNTINKGYGVIFSPSFKSKIKNEIYMIVKDETDNGYDYYRLSTCYHSETNVDIMMGKYKQPILTYISDDGKSNIYIAYQVPEKVLMKVVEQNKLT